MAKICHNTHPPPPYDKPNTPAPAPSHRKHRADANIVPHRPPTCLKTSQTPQTFLRRQNPHQIRPICAKIHPNRINTCQNRRKSCPNRRKVDQNSAKARQNPHQPHPSHPDARTVCFRSHKFPKIHSATINTPPTIAYAQKTFHVKHQR